MLEYLHGGRVVYLHKVGRTSYILGRVEYLHEVGRTTYILGRVEYLHSR